MYIFLHQHYARSCILRVSHLKTARPMHFLVDPLIHLTCLVWWKRNMQGIEIFFNTFPQVGGGLSRENISFWGAPIFNKQSCVPACLDTSTGHSGGNTQPQLVMFKFQIFYREVIFPLSFELTLFTTGQGGGTNFVSNI